MRQKAAVGLAVILVLAAGFVRRSWTAGADNAPAMAAAVASLERMPLTIGSWRGTPQEMDGAELAGAGYAGAVWRRYEDTATGSVVSVLLICGRPGRVAVHSPDVCYPGAGYEMLGEPTRAVLPLPDGAAPAEFWKARFARPADAAQRPLGIYWSWTAGERWQAVDSPRLAFAGVPVLYKLYVVAATGADPGSRDVAAEFAQRLLPQLAALLTSAPPGGDKTIPGRN